MKKTFILTFAIAATALFSSCSGGETKKRPWDKDKDTETEVTNSAASEPVKMEEIPSDGSGSAEAGLADYTGNANYRKLMSIAEKCDNPNFSIEDLSQSDYTFMINFCNMMMDAAEEADAQGISDEWLEEYKEFEEILIGFSQLLEYANSQNLLDSSNSHDYTLMMRRATRLSNG